jgi:hypothetical protein
MIVGAQVVFLSFDISFLMISASLEMCEMAWTVFAQANEPVLLRSYGLVSNSHLRKRLKIVHTIRCM